jgi:hypothetical protein
MDEIPVRISDCRCPGALHDGQEGRDDGDIAYLRPFLNYAQGAEAMRMMRAADGDVEKFAELVGPIYLKHGVVSWNKVDENGPLPCTPEAVAALRFEDAYWLANKADDLYGGAVLSPLVKQIETLSRIGPTNGSTSASSRSRSNHRARSGRSSRGNTGATTPSTG